MLLKRREVIAGIACSTLVLPGIARAQTDLVIRVTLPLDRRQTGTLSLEDSAGNSLVSGLQALGKADNQRAASEGNSERDPTLPFGDTPEGSYEVPRIVDTGPGTAYSASSYGPEAAIVLRPVAGQALTARNNGRVGLLIHSGAPGSSGRLRATHGCVRLSDADMTRLLTAIRQAGDNPTFNRCEIVRVSVLVGNDADEGAGADESDPPPGIEDLLSPLPIVIP